MGSGGEWREGERGEGEEAVFYFSVAGQQTWYFVCSAVVVIRTQQALRFLPGPPPGSPAPAGWVFKTDSQGPATDTLEGPCLKGERRGTQPRLAGDVRCGYAYWKQTGICVQNCRFCVEICVLPFNFQKKQWRTPPPLAQCGR
jgi:hypothetical protein